MGPVSQNDDSLHRGQAGQQFSHQLGKREVNEQHAVFGVVDDELQLVRKKPGVNRVANRSQSGNRVPGFQVPVRVPGQRANTFVSLQAKVQKRIGQPARALERCPVVLAMNPALNGMRDDLLLAMPAPGMLQNGYQVERLLLHQWSMV